MAYFGPRQEQAARGHIEHASTVQDMGWTPNGLPVGAYNHNAEQAARESRNLQLSDTGWTDRWTPCCGTACMTVPTDCHTSRSKLGTHSKLATQGKRQRHNIIDPKMMIWPHQRHTSSEGCRCKRTLPELGQPVLGTFDGHERSRHP